MSVEEKLKRALSDIVRVIEEGGELVIDDPNITLFMQSEQTGATVMVYTQVWEKGNVITKSVTSSIKSEMLISCNYCDCMLVSDPLKRVIFWSFNVRAPFKIKSVQIGRFGQKAVRIDIIRL
ncbi:MAG: hypothetical protein QW320_11625 [Ignisphaera sp.]